MDDGRVLTFGTDANGMQGGQFIYDIYDPVTGTHQTLANTVGTDIFCSAAMIIPGTDKVLIAGGDARPDGRPNTGVNDVNILDMKTGELYAAPDGDMVNQRWYPTMVSLEDGRMVMLGGSDGAGRHQDTAEVYTPGVGWKALTGAVDADLGRAGHYPRAFLDTDGNVVYFSTGRGADADIEVMSLNIDANGGTGSITEIGKLPFNATWENPAVQFDVGKILIQDSGSGLWVMDISGNGVQFEKVADMGSERNWSNMTVLPDGTVLINGGSAVGNTEAAANKTAAIWDPETNQVTEMAAENAPRLYHSTAVLLNDGSVLSAGGGAAGFAENNYLDAQTYMPTYLYDQNGQLAQRPVIEAAPSEIRSGQTFIVNMDSTDDIARVTFVKNGAATHAFNMGTAFVEAQFSTGFGNGNLTVTAPTTAEGLSSGDWMMFVWDKNGVPSIAPNVSVVPSNLPIDPGAEPQNLLVNGSFEVPNPTDTTTWVTSLDGWQTDGKWFEIHGDKNIDANASHGQTALGLDGSSKPVYQQVQTETGQTYDLSFTYETEALASNIWNIGLQVLWNDEVVATIKPGDGEMRAYDFKVVGTGGVDKLTFQATPGTNALLGGLLDNVVLKSDGTDPIPMPDPDPVDPAPVDPDPIDPDPVDPAPVDPDPVNPNPADPDPNGTNLLTNGSFENPNLGLAKWGVTDQMEGWTSENNQFEVWNDGFEGIAAKDGVQQVEIDSERGAIYQSIQLEENQIYELSFHYELRDHYNYRGGIEVHWNDQLVDTIEPGNGEAGIYTYEVVGTGGNDTVKFKATDTSHSTVAGILDKVELTDTGKAVAAPVDPAPVDPDPVSPDPVDPDPVDPDPVDPDPVDPAPVDPDPVDPDPVDPDPVDPAPVENLVYNKPNEVQHLKGSDGQIDVFVVGGNSNDFNWGDTQDGKGTVIWQGADFDVMHGFDVLRFDDLDVSITKGDAPAPDPDKGGITVNDIKGQTQHLQGTDDVDTFVVDAVSTDYGWGVAQDGEGAVVWSGADFDVLHDFEQIQFDDMSVTLDH